MNFTLNVINFDYFIANPQEAEPVAAECSFDRDTCGWRYNGTGNRADGLEWRLATPSRRPANLPDHTFGAPSKL